MTELNLALISPPAESYPTSRILAWLLTDQTMRRAVLEAAPFGPGAVEGTARALSSHFLRGRSEEQLLAADLTRWCLGLCDWEQITADLITEIQFERSMVEEPREVCDDRR